MSFDDIFREFRRCRYVIALTTLLGIGVAVAYWKLAPAEFESYARILVLPKDPALASATTTGERYDHEDVSDDLLATHIEVMRSDAIVDAALRIKVLDALTMIKSHLSDGESVTDHIISRLLANQGGEGSGKDARIINVGFRHYDPEATRQVVEAVVLSYQAFLVEQFQDVTSEATSLISQAQDQLEIEIEELETQQLNLRREGPMQVSRGDQTSNIHEDIFAEIETEISEIRIRMANAESRLKAIHDARSDGRFSTTGINGLSLIDEEDASRLSVFTDMVRSAASQPAFLVQQPFRAEVARAEYDRLVSLRATERTLLDDYGSKHPDVTKTQNEIAVLQEMLSKREKQIGSYDDVGEVGATEFLEAYTTALEYDTKVMKDRLVTLRTMASQEETRAKELVNFELSGNILSSRIDRKQQLYDAVVSRVNDVQLRSDYGSMLHEVLVPPKAGKRVWPRLSICGLAGAAGGFLLGGCITLITFFASKRFRTIGELSRDLQVPILAHLPRLEGSRYRSSARADSDGDDSRANWSRLMELQFASRSHAASSFRSLRNAIMFVGRQASPKLLLVTSPRPGDGKSVTAANMALSLAQAGRSVLLVDAHLEKPHLHEMFGCHGRPGLGDILEARADFPDTIAVLDTHLRLLPAGTLNASESDAYQSNSFRQFCELVRETFEFVVFDGPPILGVSAAQGLASIVDNVVLVARVSKDTRAEIVSACGEVGRHGGHLSGVVANIWDASGSFTSDVGELAIHENRLKFVQQSNPVASNGEGRMELPSYIH